MSKKILFYILIIGIFSFLLWLTLQFGKSLEAGKILENNVGIESGESITQSLFQIIENFIQNFTHPLAILILQILTIILIARLFGWLMIKIGQPTVIGEIIAGIALGPSLIGAVFPEFSNFLFPTSSLMNLQFLSQIG